MAYDINIATTCTATLSTRKDEYTSTNRLGLQRARLSTVDHAAHTATHTPRRPNDRPALRSPPTDTASVLRGRLERRCGSPCARKSPGAHKERRARSAERMRSMGMVSHALPAGSCIRAAPARGNMPAAAWAGPATDGTPCGNSVVRGQQAPVRVNTGERCRCARARGARRVA